MKKKDARVATTQNIDFSNTQGQITPVRGRIWSKFKLIRDVMDVLVTSKNKEEPNKNEGASMATTLNIGFSNTQGQIKLRVQRSDLVEIRTHPRSYRCPCYFQE